MAHSIPVICFAVLLAAGTQTAGARAESVSLTYAYYTIGGATPDEIEAEMVQRGPTIKGSKNQHAGSTRLEFGSNIGFQDKNGLCRPVSAKVSIKAKITLPKWKRPRDANTPAKIFWNVISADIEAHEKHHLTIARNMAKRLEKAIMAMPAAKNCNALFKNANALKDKHLARHDAEQEQFDRDERQNIERRLLAKLKQQAEKQKIKK